MALPLKTGADLYNQQLIRARLQNLGAQPNTADVGLGQVYFNTGTNTAASLRIGYCYETGSVPKFHHVANLEDVNRLEELISALSGSSSESVASVLGRVITLEGYFSNGKAKDADLLDGHNSDYFATASGLSALQEKVSAFLDGEADSDAVLENLKEIQAFLDSYDGATSLADMFGAVNTQIADRYTKGEVDTKLSAYRLLTNGTFDVLVEAKKGIETDEITIGGIKLSVVDRQLQIDGDAFATGQFASGGIGSEGSGSGASGIVILEDWEKYDDTLAQVLGAGLGVGLRDKIAALESKATNVSVAQTLTSGKEIGAITIDGVATKLFAPDDYLPLGGGTITGLLTLKPQGYHAIDIVSPDNNLAQITMSTNDTLRGIFQYNANFGFGFHHLGCGGLYVASDGVPKYVDSSSAKYPIIHEGNYNLYALPLSGGTLTDSVMVNHSSGSKGYLLLTNGASIGGLVTNGTAVELFNVNGYGIGVEGTSDVYVLTNWVKKTLLHAGNVGDYKAGGLVAIDSRNKNYAPYSNEFTKKALTSHFERALSIGYGANDYYVSMLHISPWSEESGGPEHQLAFRHDGAIGHRYGSEVWSNWRTLAFIDSNVASATKLQTARTIWGQSFDGTGDVSGTLYYVNNIYPNSEGERYIGTSSNPFKFMYAEWYGAGAGKTLSFGANNGTHLFVNTSGNVTIGNSDLASTTYKLYVGGDTHIDGILSTYYSFKFLRESENYIAIPANGSLSFKVGDTVSASLNSHGNVTIGAGDYAQQNCKLFVDGAINVGTYGALHRDANNHLWVNYGGSAAEKNLILCGYNTSFYYGKGSNYQSAMFISSSGNVGIGTTAPAYRLHVYGTSSSSNPLCVESANTWGESSIAFKSKSGYLWTAGLSVGINNSDHFGFYSDTAKKVISRITPTGMVVDGDIHVTGNIIADGQVSSGGVAEAGTGGAGGGSALDRVPFTIPVNTTSFTCEHNLGTREISVSIYEDGNDFQQVLADVYLDSTNVARIVFGSATDVVHKVVIIG